MESARLKMAGLCARAEQCEFEIEKKLFRLGLPHDKRKEVIEFLKSEKYLDESRYASSFTHDKALFAGWGPFKIRAELRMRKISSSAIENAIQSLPSETWSQSLKRLSSSKARAMDLTGEDGKKNSMKLYRFLLSRGFPGEDSLKTVKQLIKLQKLNGEKDLE